MESPEKVQSKISEMLRSYFQLEMFYQTKQYHNVIFHAQKCGNIAKELGFKEHETIAYNMMGLSYDALRQPEEAIRYSRMCLDICQQHPELANIEDAEMAAYATIGSAHKFMMKYDEAYAYGIVSLDLARQYSDEYAKMKSNMFLGAVCERLKRYEDAMLYTNTSIELAKQLLDISVETQAHFILGLISFGLEKYEEAAKHYEECIAMGRKNGEKTFEKRACLQLMLVCCHLKKYADQITYALACLELAKEPFDCPHLEVMLYLVLADASFLLDRYDDALDFGTRCLSMARKSGLKSIEVKMLKLLGFLEMIMFAHYDDAIIYFNQTLDIARETGNKVDKAEGLLGLGMVYFCVEDYDLAISRLKESMSFAQDVEDGQCLVRMITLYTKASHILQSYVNISLSHIEESLINSSETQTKDDVFEEGLFALEPYLSVTQEEELYHTRRVRQAMKKEFGEFYYENLGIQEQMLQMMEDMAQLNTSTLKNDYSKLLSYAFSLNTYYKMFFNECLETSITKINATTFLAKKQYDKALESFQALLVLAKKQFMKTLEARCSFNIGSIHQILGQIEEAEKSYRRAIDVLQSLFDRLHRNDALRIRFLNAYDEYYKTLSYLLIKSNREEEAFLILEDCRARVLRNTLAIMSRRKQEEPTEQETMDVVHSLVSKSNYSIVFYSVVLNELYTFVVDTDGLQSFSQPVKNCEIIDEVLKELRMMRPQPDRCVDRALEYLEGQGQRVTYEEDELRRKPKRSVYEEPRRDENKRSLRNVLEDLHQMLLGHVMGHRPIADEIVIIADGPIAKVPFAALLDPKTGAYLSETKKIRCAPSITTLKMIRERPMDQTSKDKPLIIGSPLVGTVIMNGEERDIEPLFGALDEAIDIAALLGVRPLVAANATKPAVLEKLRQGVSVVHIAAHGILSKATIVLAPSPEIRETKPIPDEEDYMLTMADVQQAQVHAQLVVLSCCHSGRGKIRAEGVVGMCRAFLASGARAVVASLWAIDDEATLEFMKIFYGQLKDGKSASTSLQMTMNEMRNTADYKEPKYWAPFFLLGDDVTLQL